jgi:predicted ArsR family transcriptional regulator
MAFSNVVRVLSMSEASDRELLDLIRRRGPLSVGEMSELLGVTGTAVRNRLARLLSTGLVDRRVEHGSRGRPKHQYQASALAHKGLGQNYADLALALWEEMMGQLPDRKLRRALFTRITERMAEIYRARVTGREWEGRLVQLSGLLHDRGIEAEVATDGAGPDPILRQHSCPYFELAETDPAICALERKMFEKVLGRGLRLSQCRLHGDRSCDFQAKPVPVNSPNSP